MPTADFSTKVETIRFYLQNSVTCLQSDWWQAFGFVGSTFKSMKKLLIPEKEGNLGAGKIPYQCGNPFVKLRLAKSEMLTAPVTYK